MVTLETAFTPLEQGQTFSKSTLNKKILHIACNFSDGYKLLMLHCKKSLGIFQSPAGMLHSKLSQAGNNLPSPSPKLNRGIFFLQCAVDCTGSTAEL